MEDLLKELADNSVQELTARACKTGWKACRQQSGKACCQHSGKACCQHCGKTCCHHREKACCQPRGKTCCQKCVNACWMNLTDLSSARLFFLNNWGGGRQSVTVCQMRLARACNLFLPLLWSFFPYNLYCAYSTYFLSFLFIIIYDLLSLFYTFFLYIICISFLLC